MQTQRFSFCYSYYEFIFNDLVLTVTQIVSSTLELKPCMMRCSDFYREHKLWL